MKKIVVSEFQQETNSFNPVITTLKDFERRVICLGKEMFPLQQQQREAGGDVSGDPGK